MRKRPKQARSRATVAVIVEATAQVLAQAGWAAFTTNEVAERAGVSIGSVYQYFPRREALLEAVRDRHFAELLPALEAVARGRRFSDRVSLLVDGMIAAHREPPGLHRALLDVAHPLHVSETSGRLDDAYRAAFAALAGSAKPSNTRITVAAAALEGAIHDAAKRGILDEATTRAALVDLLTGLLSSPTRSKAAGKAP